MNGWNSILPADDGKGREVSRVSWGPIEKNPFIQLAILERPFDSLNLQYRQKRPWDSHMHWNCWWFGLARAGFAFEKAWILTWIFVFTNRNLHVAGLVNEERRTTIDGCSYHLTTICPHSCLAPLRVNKLWRAPFVFRNSPLQYMPWSDPEQMSACT